MPIPETGFSKREYFLVCVLSTIISAITIIISILILILVWRTKPLLHTVRHLLMCNACMASILYSITQIINYTSLIFIQYEMSDLSCRWLAYLSYIGICAVVYSYLIQTISRIFMSLLASKYRLLTTLKAHGILIGIKWLTIILIPLPALITSDIEFRPHLLCWVPMEQVIHVIYVFLSCYIVPTLSALLIYAFIYYRLKKMIRDSGTLRSNNNRKRDLEVLRNILILLCIYLFGGLPSVLFFITNLQVIYLISLVFISLAVAVEKIVMCIIDRDIRHILENLFNLKNRVVPIKPLAEDQGHDPCPQHVQLQEQRF